MSAAHPLRRLHRLSDGVLLCAAILVVSACQPTVRLEAPREPIVINLNVKIEQEVRVRLDRELDEVFRENSNLF